MLTSMSQFACWAGGWGQRISSSQLAETELSADNIPVKLGALNLARGAEQGCHAALPRSPEFNLLAASPHIGVGLPYSPYTS